MNTTDATKVCETNGARLIHYETARVAKIELPSGEQVLISIGTASAKLYRKNRLFGWFLPRSFVSKPLVEWDPRYCHVSGFDRDVFRGMILDGLLSLLSRFKSIDELNRGWPTMKNPMEVASLEFYRRLIPKPAK